jgi:hypothetical protein
MTQDRDSANRARARIGQVGFVRPDGTPVGWMFVDPGYPVPFMELLPDGTRLWCGWTVQELKDISEYLRRD